MADNTLSNNPWKGLNFYVEGEVLYGRNSEIESLSHYIFNDTQTVLYGHSGIGKSSILNAGIFPLARRQGMLPVGIRLDHSAQTPYVRQIHDAIVASGADVRERVPAVSHDGSETLWEYMHRHVFFDADGRRVQLLIVLDQFEEIFTLQQQEPVKRAFFDELADLLNDVTPLYIVNAGKQQEQQHGDAEEVEGILDLSDIDIDLDDLATEMSSRYLQKVDYHIVFTIREDFLSYLERYTAYIPLMKTNRYALLPLNEEQAADIIMKPREGLVGKDVAELIIRKVTGKDQFALDGIPEIDVDAAVLSLYLSRLYIKKGAAPTISARLVNQFSADIINDFYTESVADLPAHEIETLEDELLTYDGRRNNVSRGDLLREGISPEVIRTLVEDRKLLRQFSYQDDIRIEFMHDILCPVVDGRISQREAMARQQAERRRQEAEKALLMRKSRRRLTLSVVSTVVLVMLALLYWMLFRMPYAHRYATFTTHDGWPVGIGQTLSDDDTRQMVVHYRLTRRGMLPSFSLANVFSYVNPYVLVEVLNRNGQPATNILVESPLVALSETDADDDLSRRFAHMQLLTASWRYAADERGQLARQTAYGTDGTALYSVLYYRDIAQDDEAGTQMLWMNYVDPEGKSLRVRRNGADRMRATLSGGRLVAYQFFNETGTPQRNSRGAYGYRYDVDLQQGYLKAIIPVDEYGDSMPGQALRFTAFDGYQRWTHAGSAKAEYGPDRIIYRMPDRTDSLLYSDVGRQRYRSETMTDRRSTFSYDRLGQLTDHSVYAIRPDGRSTLMERTTQTYILALLKERTHYSAGADVPYTSERHTYSGHGIHTVTYYGGHTPGALRPANKPGQRYYKTTTTEQETTSGRLTTSTYWAKDSITGRDVELRRELCAYDASGLMQRRTVYEGGKRAMSMVYEASNGLVTGQHVVGLCGDTIRCPQWEPNRLTYYRMQAITNFAGDTVAMKAVNEFGEESIVAYGNQEISIGPAPGEEMMTEGKNYLVYGMANYEYSTRQVPDSRMVQYLHITDTTAAAYRCGLRDGDIVLSHTAGKMLVARANKAKKTYDIKPVTLQEQAAGMEVYPVPFTEREMKRLQEAIKNHREL